MTVHENYDVIAFKSCIQKFTVWLYSEKTSPKGFSASKCDIADWIFSKLEIFEKFDFLGGIFLEDFFGGFFYGGFSWEELFVYIVKVS